ncbi:multiprotein-bridging factor 1 family protein [Streptomyces californicus]|uniref:helix-turn-helix domain-containing protein n=1 Tax=Streptomyces californicus TaxID=67351 RepID=UPI0036BA4C9E
MGNHQQPWMFAEDRFGRRMRKEREDRAMTQSDVANVLAEEHDLKLHATAIAKMEQRDVEKPRSIRLSEARAIADMFGLTLDEMTSAGDTEIQALAEELVQLNRQASAISAATDSVLARLRSYAPIMAAPVEQLTPELLQARGQIAKSLNSLELDFSRSSTEAVNYLSEWNEAKKQGGSAVEGAVEQDDLRAARVRATSALWIEVMHTLYPGYSSVDIADDAKLDNGDSAYRIAALVEAPEGHLANWILCTVVSLGLWGRGTALELDRRVSSIMAEDPSKGAHYAKRLALSDMAAEIEFELQRRWQEIMTVYPKVLEIWDDAERLEEFTAESVRKEARSSGGEIE